MRHRFAALFTLTVCLLVTSALASPARAAFVDVHYDTTGSAGDWTMNVTFHNQLINSHDAPGDWIFYKLGLSLPGTSIIGSPFAYNVSGPTGEYNHVWTFQQNGWTNANVMLFPQAELDGFLLHSTADQPPSIIPFFMTGSAQTDNGRTGFHSGGRFHGLTVATLKGLANGTLVQAPQGLTPVPLPPSILLFGAGFASLLVLQLRRRVLPLFRKDAYAHALS
jgi:hypothetical protein